MLREGLLPSDFTTTFYQILKGLRTCDVVAFLDSFFKISGVIRIIIDEFEEDGEDEE